MLDGLLPLTDPVAVFAVLFLLVLLGPITAERLRLPAIIGLVVAGMLVGPNVANILGRGTFIDALGFIGLLYLMFQAGLDLDLSGFFKRRRESVLFGVLTVLVPMALVTAVALALDIPPLAALIIASAFTSHTLLSYPTVVKFHLTANPAVTTTLGATLLCNTVALLILAVAAAAVRGIGGALFWLSFSLGLVSYLGVVLFVVPRVTRWFFTGLGWDRQIRLTYLLSGMGVAAVVARLVGIEPIVGAFLIGLAFNRFVPEGTIIAERVRVLGQSLFIPAFLISTGMILDPRAIVTDNRTLLLGAGFTLATVVAKWLAAEVAGRTIGYDRAERGLMFSLSVGQAAGALAAVIVAEKLGLVGSQEVNAVVLVILATALVAGLIADRHAPRIEVPETAERTLGSRVVVPVSNPDTVGLLVRVAGQIAAGDAGVVVAVNVLPFDAQTNEVRAHRNLGRRAEEVALAAGAEVTTTVRIDSSTVGGILHTVVEQGGTSVVIGWKGYANAREGLFGSTIDQIVAHSPVPVLVCRPGSHPTTGRIVVIATEEDLRPGTQRGLALAFEVAGRLSRQANARVIVVTDTTSERLRPYLATHRVDETDVEVITQGRMVDHLPDLLQPHDIVIAGVPPTTSRLGRGARRVAQAATGHTVIVAVPH